MSVSLGIDLGTTNSVCAVPTPGGVRFVVGANGECVVPSAVAYLWDGSVVVGAEARLHAPSNPASTVLSAKRLMGQRADDGQVQLALASVPYMVVEGENRQLLVDVGGKHRSIPSISAEVLRMLVARAEAMLGEPVHDAVITVPANFTDAQRKATHEAGRLAGLNVLRLINEPTAAALAYGFGHERDGVVAVFDFGGGTFDISVLRLSGEVFEVLASDGDFFLGGDDIDMALTEHLAGLVHDQTGVDPRKEATLVARLKLAAEEIKRYLSVETVASGTIEGLELPRRSEPFALNFEVTRSQFERMAGGYIEQCMTLCDRVMTGLGMDPQSISEVICVGGSTRIPLVRKRVSEFFGRQPATRINPDEVVAYGAAVHAGILSAGSVAVPASSDGAVRQDTALLLDVAPATLSIGTAGGYVERLLDKNAPIPIETTKVFTTAKDHQTRVVIDCCRGEESRFNENEVLGSIVLEELPDALRGEVRIKVTFRVDSDGILNVRAADESTGREQQVSLSVIGAPELEPQPMSGVPQ